MVIKMKKTIVTILTFLFGVVVCYFLFSQGENVIHLQRLNLTLQEKINKKSAVPVLDAVNERNSQINNISCNLHAIAQAPGKRPAKLNGVLFYEKQRKFKMELDSFLGPELNIGSDGEKFWFWSRRMKNPGLYWSSYENLYKTKLKTPFNPLWLSHCLGIDPINYEDATIDKDDGNRWRVIKKTINAKREPITAIIYVDPKRNLITGHGIYDQDGVLCASSEIEEFNGTFPAKITFIWHKEDASMIWHLDSVRFNATINTNEWVMPNITPKIDMSHD